MRHSRVSALVVAASVTATVLAGCGTSKNPKTELDEILAVTGNQVFSVSVLMGGSGNTDVSVGATHDGSTGYYSNLDGDIINDSHMDPPAGSTVDASVFSLSALTDLADKAIKRDEGCAPASAYASVTPSGATAMWVECSTNNPTVDTTVDEMTTLDGKPFSVPALDMTTADGVTSLDQAVTAVLGSPELSEIWYYLETTDVVIRGATTTNTQGDSCTPTINASRVETTNSFPVACNTEETASASFIIEDYGAQTISDIITRMTASSEIDQRALGAIHFTTDGTSLMWEGVTTSIEDRLAHKDILEGSMPKP